MSRALYALVACSCGKLHNVVPTSRRASKGSTSTRMGAGRDRGLSMLGEMPDNADRDGAAGVSRTAVSGRVPPLRDQGAPSRSRLVAPATKPPAPAASGPATRARAAGGSSMPHRRGGSRGPMSEVRSPA